jgi:hypothetical protein
MTTIVDKLSDSLQSGRPIKRDDIAELIAYVKASEIAIPETKEPSLDTQVSTAIDGGQNRLTIVTLITMAELFIAKINFDQVLDIYTIEAQANLRKALEQAKKLVG